MIRFYSPGLPNDLILPENDSQHCCRVLRHAVGDTIEVVDGRGHLYKCIIVDSHPKRTAVEIIETIDCQPCWPNNITIAVAPTKLMDRMEWLVEKLTEIGVNRIVPILCEHSERKEIKTERLEKISISAMKQSLKTVLPIIDEMTPLNIFLRSITSDSQKFVGYCDETTERVLLAKALTPKTDVVMLIGPEGDFSPQEICKILDAGFIPVTLGENRLRTETAALMACETVHVVNMINL